jgi:hypothetical protein
MTATNLHPVQPKSTLYVQSLESWKSNIYITDTDAYSHTKPISVTVPCADFHHIPVQKLCFPMSVTLFKTEHPNIPL